LVARHQCGSVVQLPVSNIHLAKRAGQPTTVPLVALRTSCKMAGSVLTGDNVWQICLLHALACLSWGRSVVVLEEFEAAPDYQRKSIGVRYDLFCISVQNYKVIGDFERHPVDTVLSEVGSDRRCRPDVLRLGYAANHSLPRCQYLINPSIRHRFNETANLALGCALC
jgi:hypothetical protein